MESLSAYARQFLDQMQKPDVDFIEGLSPAIAIEQRTSGSNPRSTIATTTEIYDHLRLLYAHIGLAHCPDTGVPISTQSTSDIVDKILKLPAKTRVMLLAPVVRRQKGEFRDVFERLAREGFVRVRVDGAMHELARNIARIKLDKKKFHDIEAVVDRLVMDEKIRVRLGDSVETALRWGEGVMFTLHQLPETGKATASASAVLDETWIETLHSNKMCSPATGKSYDPPTPKHFRSTPRRVRAQCAMAWARKWFLTRRLVVPVLLDLPLDGAIQPWRRRGQAAEYLLQGDVAFAGLALRGRHGNAVQEFLPENFRKVLLEGTGDQEIDFSFWRAGKISKDQPPFASVLPDLERLATDSEANSSATGSRPT